MRGHDKQQADMFSYLSPEVRVRKGRPLRAIRTMADQALETMSRRFDAMYAKTGRPSIPPEIHVGSDAAMQPAPAREDESEWRKMLGAVLMNGTSLTIFDNVDHRLQSASLALAVTASTWTDRILGQTKTITLPVRCTWIATGNNLQLGGDLPHRSYWTRLDAGTSQPWQRVGLASGD
jgi:hypothetical protein